MQWNHTQYSILAVHFVQSQSTIFLLLHLSILKVQQSVCVSVLPESKAPRLRSFAVWKLENRLINVSKTFKFVN